MTNDAEEAVSSGVQIDHGRGSVYIILRKGKETLTATLSPDQAREIGRSLVDHAVEVDLIAKSWGEPKG